MSRSSRPSIGIELLEEPLIHVLLEVSREQESLQADPDVEDERGVVDRSSRVWRGLGHAARRRPDDLGACPADREGIAARKLDDADTVAVGLLAKRGVAAAVAAHPVLGEHADPVARQQPGQPADVILVRVGEQHDIDATVPDRDALVETSDEDVRVASAVDEDTRPVVRLDEDRIALADVEDRDEQGPARPGDERDRRGTDDGDRAHGSHHRTADPAPGRVRDGGPLARRVEGAAADGRAVPAADAPERDEQRAECDRRAREVERERQVGARQRERRHEIRGAHHHRERQPGGEQDGSGQHGGERRRDHASDDRRDESAQHRERHDRGDDEVGERRDE